MSEKRPFYRSRCWLRQCLLALLLLPALLPQAQARLTGPQEGWVEEGHIRDLGQVRRSRQIRVLINESRHSSALVRGKVVGLEYQRLQAFMAFLNEGLAEGQRIQLRLIPLPKDQLALALARGEGDLLLPGELLPLRAGLPLRASAPLEQAVPLVIVHHRNGRKLRSLQDLAGRSLALTNGSIARERLQGVNPQLKRPVIPDWQGDSMAVEDVLEMVDAGLLEATAVELPIAERWSTLYRNLQIAPQLQLGAPARRYWYVHRAAPNLLAQVDRFLSQPWQAPEELLSWSAGRRYRLQNPLGRTELQRLQKVLPSLMLRAQAHKLEWPLLAAIAFKESTLNPNARSTGGGASGLMQVTPVAAQAVGMRPPTTVADNIEVAARYLTMLRNQYFASSRINERERMAFMLAAYNMGINRLQGLRAEARQRGLDADRWFFQVERIAMERYGMGMVSYVAAVNKYYQVYRRERYRLEP